MKVANDNIQRIAVSNAHGSTSLESRKIYGEYTKM